MVQKNSKHIYIYEQDEKKAFWFFPTFEFRFEKLLKFCQNSIQIGMVNKLAIVKRIVHHILHRNITQLAIRTTKSTKKSKFRKVGGKWKRAEICSVAKFEITV